MSVEAATGAPLVEPTFSVLDVEAVPHTATPTLRFHLHVEDPLGREIHTIVLSTQINIDPARRAYDPETRERLVELFGAPERWGATTEVFRWAHIDVLVKGFTGATSFALDVPCTLRPRGGRQQVLLLAARRRGAAVVPVQRDGPLQRRGATACRWPRCHGAARRAGACPWPRGSA